MSLSSDHLVMRSSRLLRAALALAIALAASGAFVVAPVSASTNAPTPSWWNGDCDANHWNLAAAAQGWTGPGAHRLGASYLGIPVCGPRRSVDGAPDVQWSKPGWGHFEWECTELAFRFMYLVYGVTPYGANGNTVVANYKPSYGGGLVTVTNGTVGTAPQPGDVMSFDSPSGFGHAAVVTSSQLNAQGTGTVTLMSQNDTTDGWRTLSVNAWKVQPFGSYVPSAWLHDPAGRGGTGVAAPTTGSPSSSTSGPKSTVFLRNSLTTGVADASFPFGPPGAQVLSCDWDGDGVDTPAWFLNGTWGITNKNVAGADVWMVSFGQAGDVPLCGDWNGTGKDTIGVWRDGVFLLRNINTGGPPNAMFAFGSATDRPVVGDWTGQGKDTVGVYRKGAYLLRNSNSAGPADAVFGYGDPGDQPLVGDWNGDGKDTIGIWRNGALYLKNTNATGVADYVFGYGNPGDAPIIGDWNGQGKDTLGVVRG